MLKSIFRPKAVIALVFFCLLFTSPGIAQVKESRPNILWIMTDDMGVELGCYGTPHMRTPNIDRLAKEGTRFTRCFTTAPVCSPSRSAIMTGMYQTTINAHHHRSTTTLPKDVKPITEHFRDGGYCTVNLKKVGPLKSGGKTDLNFRVDAKTLFDGEDFDDLKTRQPFFAEFQIHEPHRGSWKGGEQLPHRITPDQVQLPPYYPDTPVTRKDWAGYLNAIQHLDEKVGTVLDLLEKNGLADNTIVFFFADNGRCHVRDKQWLYEGGLQIPLIVRWPGKIKMGDVRDDLISAIDISVTSMKLAGIKLPDHLQGQVFLGPKIQSRKYIFGARDRCDMTEDRIRSIRDDRYKYIRNFMPERPYTQYNEYKERAYPALDEMQRLHKEGKLTPAQALFMASEKPVEELYDLNTDPHEIHNLASSKEHQPIKKRLSAQLAKWMKECDDRPEKKGDPRK